MHNKGGPVVRDLGNLWSLRSKEEEMKRNKSNERKN